MRTRAKPVEISPDVWMVEDQVFCPQCGCNDFDNEGFDSNPAGTKARRLTCKSCATVYFWFIESLKLVKDAMQITP